MRDATRQNDDAALIVVVPFVVRTITLYRPGVRAVPVAVMIEPAPSGTAWTPTSRLSTYTAMVASLAPFTSTVTFHGAPCGSWKV